MGTILNSENNARIKEEIKDKIYKKYDEFKSSCSDGTQLRSKIEESLTSEERDFFNKPELERYKDELFKQICDNFEEDKRRKDHEKRVEKMIEDNAIEEDKRRKDFVNSIEKMIQTFSVMNNQQQQLFNENTNKNQEILFEVMAHHQQFINEIIDKSNRKEEENRRLMKEQNERFEKNIEDLKKKISRRKR